MCSVILLRKTFGPIVNDYKLKSRYEYTKSTENIFQIHYFFLNRQPIYIQGFYIGNFGQRLRLVLAVYNKKEYIITYNENNLFLIKVELIF